MKKRTLATVLILAAAISTAAVKDPFEILAGRWIWAIEAVSQHQKPGDVFNDVPPPKVNMAPEPAKAQSAKKAPSTGSTKAETKPREPITRKFKTTTAWAALSATITDYGDKFTVQVTSDQPVMGWALKKQSDKNVFLKGAVNGHTTFAFDVNQPYIRDFGLTVYVTDNSYPAFLPLYE